VDYDILVNELAQKIKNAGFTKVYGVPKNGSVIAESLRKYDLLNVSLEEADCVVDDLIDSGRTKSKYNKPFFTLIEKNGEWIHFWFEKETKDDAEDLVVRQLEMIGENPIREGLLDTPRRVVKMFKETFVGYDKSKKPNVTTFKNGTDGLVYDQMIVDEGIYYSHCEHHMVPFFGDYWFAYIPHKKGKILGLSKVARVVDYHSARLQVQERLVNDIVNDLWNALSEDISYPPIGMGLVLQGRHLCKEMRGVKRQGRMTTIELRGSFKDDINCRQEFLKFVNGGK
jgi:GTP cyclohydrolase I